MADEYYHYSKVKRERMRKMRIRGMITDMRKNLPVYNLEEIREYKMPYYDALVTNLEEKGLESSSSFLQQLVAYQDHARHEAGPGSNVWMRPQLQFSNKELKYLTEELQKAEEFNATGSHWRECEVFLRLGIHFAFGHADWWWLGEQILVQSINVSGSYPTLQGDFEALSRFAYAKFLIRNLKEYETAKEQLLVARDLAANKGQAVRDYFPDERPGTLYMLINYYTHKCLMKEVRNLMPTDYEKAIDVSVQAKKRAGEACHKEGETQALLMKGLCEMNVDNAKSAIFSFNKALKLQEAIGNKEGLCKVMIQLAKAYLMDNNTSQSLRILNKLKDTAAKYHLHFYLAQAYKNMGEHYLNNGEYAIARKLLNKSLSYFEEERDGTMDIALVQLLEAIAWGLELFPKYVDLVFKSGNTSGSAGIENLNKLIDWKDSRKPFWSELEAETSFADMMAADHQVVRHSTEQIEKYKRERRLLREAKRLALASIKLEKISTKSDDALSSDALSAESQVNIFSATVQEIIIHQTDHINAEELESSMKIDDSKIVSDEKEVVELHDNKEKFMAATPSYNNDDVIGETEE